MSSIDVNGTRLYHEERGRGPAVLFISGATGDAGHWTEAADILAVAYTVITYDRRANSRSPRPAGWASTTVGEQAADAAALLRGLDLVPAIVFGTSAGAGILADLCLRHPHVLRGAIFHEPVFPSGVSNLGAVRAGRNWWRRAWARAARAPRLSSTCAASPVMKSMPHSIHCCASGCSATQRFCSASRWLPTSSTSPHPASSPR
jgi:pimeloyl-ACP methyl ester carboxylesterase